MTDNPPIYVTQPALPPLTDFVKCLEAIWDRRILTNNGPFHQQLEEALSTYLGINHISLFSNGTIALITALQALNIRGEVITTPFSFVATAHALLWNGLTPVFVDVDPRTLNLDVEKIEDAITSRTTAILPVHCYGRPCDVDRIAKIAERHGLYVIYDAAHAFGVRNREGSILNFGHLSVLSFHATKVFNTFEGGAIVCRDSETKRHIDRLKNFGFVDEVTVEATGINGKMAEANAALGLLQLRGVDDAIARRKAIDEHYRSFFSGVQDVECLPYDSDCVPNYAYFPILVRPESRFSRNELYEALRAAGIFARRYFYPLITTFPMYQKLPSANPTRLPAAAKAAGEVLCLPIYPALTPSDQRRVTDVVGELCAKTKCATALGAGHLSSS